MALEITPPGTAATAAAASSTTPAPQAPTAAPQPRTVESTFWKDFWVNPDRPSLCPVSNTSAAKGAAKQGDGQRGGKGWGKDQGAAKHTCPRHTSGI